MENNNKRCRGVRENNNNHQDDDEDEAEAKRSELNNNNNNRMRTWHHPSSRIYRVSRASGGKDRHSKVYTSKGLRDRRIRLSVSTAIQFYDLQDRLGYDQPSKAIEWLIKAAQSAIDELPSLDTHFPEPMDQNINVENHLMVSDSVMDPDAEPSYNNNNNNNNNNNQQHSSTSETSKGSVLSLSRSEIRVKARERARERVKDKEKDRDDVHDQGLNTQGSFTKLLTGGSSTSNGVGHASSSANFIQKQQMQHNLPPVSATADFFNTQSGFSSQGHFGMVPLMGNGGSGGHSNEMQPFAFMHDHFFPVATAHAEGDYNLNFSISPGFAGFHRGTLQSNSPSHHHHHQLQLSHHHNHSNHHQVQAQRLSLALDGSSVPMPLFFGTAANAAAAANNENQYSSGFDGHLQLDAYKNLELNGKGKN